MWPFSPANPKAEDVNLSPNNEIIQTSIEPAVPPATSPAQDATTTQTLPPQYYRMGIAPIARIQLVSLVAGSAGFFKGFKKGAEVAALCFRAENAHLTPTSKAGWFLYSKSKNYHSVLGGVRQGVKTGIVYGSWTALFLTLEHGLDAARGRVFASKREKENDELRRGQADFLNTMSAAVAVAGIHSWWYQMDRFAAARMTRGAVMFSVPFGLLQDFVAWAQGQRTWYIDGVSRLLGSGSREYHPELEKKGSWLRS